jgi:hypothetical protein
MNENKTALEEAFRVLGERPGKSIPKAIPEPEVIPEGETDRRLDGGEPGARDGDAAWPVQDEASRAEQVLADSGVRLMELNGSFTIGIWSDLDSSELRDAIRTFHPDGMPPIRYLDGDGIPQDFQVRNVPGDAVPPSVREAMERNPTAPWETRDFLLTGLRAAAISEEPPAGAAPKEQNAPCADPPKHIRSAHSMDEPSPPTAAPVGDGRGQETNRETASPEGRPPMTGLKRETLKVEGDHEPRHPDLPLSDRCAGLLRVIEFHFERSYAAWERSRRMRPSMPRHADFPTFAASWLAANGDRTDGPFEDLGPVVEELRKEFPPPNTPRIARGKTYWGSA